MINYLKDQYYWLKNYNTLFNFFQGIQSDKILLFGYPKSGNTWVISGEAEGIFYNPYSEENMHGVIEFTNLEIETDEDNTPYFNYGGR